jgi:hypothetical protein
LNAISHRSTTAAHGALLPATTKDVEGLGHLFPSPSRLPGADLAVLGMPNARAMAVNSLAQAISADPTIFSRGASLEEAVAKLRSLPGIGEWTAQYIAMRALAWPDAFPHPDVAALKAMRATSNRQALATAEAWRPWRAGSGGIVSQSGSLRARASPWAGSPGCSNPESAGEVIPLGPLKADEFRKPFSVAVLFRLAAFACGPWFRRAWRER